MYIHMYMYIHMCIYIYIYTLYISLPTKAALLSFTDTFIAFLHTFFLSMFFFLGMLSFIMFLPCSFS